MNAELSAVGRLVLRTSLKGSLATLDRATGAPYVSMVSVATDSDGSPLMLLSGLARHTANFLADPRVSLLLDTTDGRGDAATGARLTVDGRIAVTQSSSAQSRFLARQPSAAQYAGFGDFAFYRLEIDHGHLIAGFGRIQPIPRTALCLDPDWAMAVSAGETNLLAQIAHENLVHRLVARLPVALHAGTSEPWRATGIDPEGVDLAAGTLSARVVFPTIAKDAVGAGAALASLIGSS